MTFNSLSPELQNILIINYEFLGKLFLLVSFWLIAFLYVQHFENNREYKFKFIGLIKGVYYIVANVFLLFSPFYILFLAPAVPFEDILRPFFFLFMTNLFVLGIFLAFNVSYYGIAFITDFVTGEKKFEPINTEVKRVFGNEGKL